MKESELTDQLEELRMQVSTSGEELRRSIHNFCRALEQGCAVVYRRNFDASSYEYMGDYIEEITGYSARAITPEIWDGLIIGTDFKGALSGLALDEANHRVRTGQVDRWQADVEIRTRTGERRWVMDLSTVVSDAAGRCYGCLGILQDITDRKLAEKELMRISAALREQNLELEADLALAAELQAALMPPQLTGFPLNVPSDQSMLRFHRLYQPTAAVGGDLFEVMALSDTKAGVFICDVMGHGVRSALVASMVRALMEELRAEAEYPGLFLARINKALHGILTRARQPMFATAFYLLADVISGEIYYANAGHPSPLYVRSKAGVEWVCPHRTENAAVLGLLPDAAYPTGRLQVSAGDAIILLTDGILEVANAREEEYGEQRLLEAVRRRCDLPMPVLLDGLMVDAGEFAGGEKFCDDVCLIAMEFAGGFNRPDRWP